MQLSKFAMELLVFPFSLLRVTLKVIFSPKLFKYFFFLLLLGLLTFPVTLSLVGTLNLSGSGVLSLEGWKDISRTENALRELAPANIYLRKPGTWAWQAIRGLYRRLLQFLEFGLVVFSKLLTLLLATALTLLILLFTWEFFFLERFISAALDDHQVFRELVLAEIGLWQVLRSAIRCLYHLVIFIILDIGIWMAALIFPPFILIGMLFSGWRLGREFLLLPLEIKGFPVDYREAAVRVHNRETVVSGVCLKLLLYMPGGFLFLPGAYALSIEKLAAWDEVRNYRPEK